MKSWQEFPSQHVEALVEVLSSLVYIVEFVSAERPGLRSRNDVNAP